MTKVAIQSGSCGFTVTVTAEKGTGRKVRISIETDCEMVQKMLEDIQELDRTAALTGFQNNPVYLSAAKHLKHPACPVPSGILKALEVEAGLNVPRDATVVFVKKKKGL
ncbi:MAG TPA: hypothetical protein VN604_00850 [Nitrospirota bacterium]|nr:hypothetical protein [Nitrospirota bacterium]